MKKIANQTSPSKKLHPPAATFSVEEYAVQYGVSLEEIQ